MIRAVRQPNPFNPPNGDVIYGADWIYGYLTPEMWATHKTIMLPNFGWQGHSSLYILKSLFKLENIEQLKDDFQYEDPWYGNKFWYWYPEWLLAKDLEFYQSYVMPNTSSDDLFWDHKFFKDQVKTSAERHSIVDIGGLTRTFIGHGYNQLTMPNDGGHCIREFVVQLDNGDFLFGHGWEWYNK